MEAAVPRPRRLKVLVLVNDSQAGGEPTPPATGAPVDAAPDSAPPSSRNAEVAPIIEALRGGGFDVSCFDLDDDIDRVGHAVVVMRPDLLVNMVEQMWGDTMQPMALCQLYDLYGYPYIGSDPLAQATCQERARTHLLLDDADVPVPGFAVVRDVNAIPDTSQLAYPQIVTQAFDDTYEYEGFSNPIHSRDELEQRIAELAVEYDMPLLVEEFIDGRHVQAIVVGNRVLDILPLTERAYDEEARAELTVLAQLDIDTAERIRQLAQRAFRTLACRDVAQVDFCVQDDGEVLVIDVRPNVDIGTDGAFATAAAATEYGYEGTIVRLARTALSRAGIESPSAAPAPAESQDEPDAGDVDADDDEATVDVRAPSTDGELDGQDDETDS